LATREILVPDLGGFKDVAVIDVLVKTGERVEPETALLTLETEKATMDVPAGAAGTIERLLVQKGGTVSEGTAIAVLKTEGDDAAAGVARPAQGAAVPPAAPSSAPAAAPPAAPKPAPSPAPPLPRAAPAPSPAPAGGPPSIPGGAVNEAGFALAHASPGVRKFARELGVDLARVRGTGTKGRILEGDVKAHVKSLLTGAAGTPAPTATAGAGLPRVQVPDFAQFGAVEVRPLGRIKRISGARLHASWVNLPHVTQFEEADITDMEAARTRLKDHATSLGVKLTPLAFVMRAVALTLARFPQFNASLDASGENLVYKKYLHVGFAADTPAGLLVPVIRDADRKDVYELARALASLSEKARAGKLSAAEMQGGCFTVSSLGGIGGTAFTPIINAPELAILGVSRASTRAVHRDGAFVPRLMLPLSLSYDHRVIDGAMAARFTTWLAQTLADPRSLLEAVP
jgi:pyruvate dehydrogenase E2 component (dihydrolipoyllysine-residue acetyltransferase)